MTTKTERVLRWIAYWGLLILSMGLMLVALHFTFDYKPPNPLAFVAWVIGFAMSRFAARKVKPQPT